MNLGAKALAAQIKERGDQRKLATDLGIDQGYLSKILRAEKTPGLETRKLLFEKLEIDVLDWDRPDPADTQPVDFRPGDTHEDIEPPFGDSDPTNPEANDAA
jgi:transcriptional regulator with XRE-family HTH domain